MDIFERVAAYRAESDQLAWNGTFKDYIELLRKNPSAAVTAHARVYDMIKSYGVEEVGGHKRYKFFEQEIFGLTGPSRSSWRNISIPRRAGLTSANGSCC